MRLGLCTLKNEWFLSNGGLALFCRLAILRFWLHCGMDELCEQCKASECAKRQSYFF